MKPGAHGFGSRAFSAAALVLSLAAGACGGGSIEIGSAARAIAACGERFVSVAAGTDANNGCLDDGTPCQTIQHAIDSACNGDTIRIHRGRYRENVVVTKPVTLHGAGDGTVVMPATSAPNPCEDSALCGGDASSVFLIRANDVMITDLVVDGDNPDLASCVAVGGADIDARNGIITDSDRGRFDRLVVINVTVKNVYLRGINAYYSTGFRFTGNKLDNIRGDRESIAIFNFGGSGEVSSNSADDVITAFAANHSAGTRFIGNYASHSLQGLHTDNPGDIAGATPDYLGGNTVFDCSPTGYGLFVFIPYVAPVFEGNQVIHCNVGIAAFGSGNPVTTRFIDNYVDLGWRAESVGVFTTTDQLGYGNNDVHAAFSGTVVTKTAIGFAMVHDPNRVNDTRLTCNSIVDNVVGIQSDSATPSAHNNKIQDNGLGADGTALAAGALSLTENFWGCDTGPGTPGCDSIDGLIDGSLFLTAAPACTEL